MGAVMDFEPEKLIVGIIYNDKEILDKALKMLTDEFGEFDGMCEEFSFSEEYSSYYDGELGGSGMRRIYSFQRTVDPACQAEIKEFTNSLEAELSVDGKRKFIVNAIKVIKESESPSEQEDLLKTVRDLTGTTYESLKRELTSVEEGVKKTEEVNTVSFSEKIGDKTVSASRFILYSYLFDKAYSVDTDIDLLEFTEPLHKEIANYISIRKKENQTVRFSDLYDLFSEDEQELSLIAGMETDENKKYDEAMYFADCIKTLKVYSIDKRIASLTKDFKDCTDAEKRRQIAIQLNALLKEKNQLY